MGSPMHKVWRFLIGVATFFLYVFVKSIFITFRIMKQTKGHKLKTPEKLTPTLLPKRKNLVSEGRIDICFLNKVNYQN